jgi:hypothetical protein
MCGRPSSTSTRSGSGAAADRSSATRSGAARSPACRWVSSRWQRCARWCAAIRMRVSRRRVGAAAASERAIRAVRRPCVSQKPTTGRDTKSASLHGLHGSPVAAPNNPGSALTEPIGTADILCAVVRPHSGQSAPTRRRGRSGSVNMGEVIGRQVQGFGREPDFVFARLRWRSSLSPSDLRRGLPARSRPRVRDPYPRPSAPASDRNRHGRDRSLGRP